jgi:hypothetical protein
MKIGMRPILQPPPARRDGGLSGAARAGDRRRTPALRGRLGLHETPVLAVHDRFETTPGLAGSAERALAVAVADSLIAMARKRA